MKKAIICGASGQDGAFLARLLLSKEYEVYAASRDAQGREFNKLIRLGIKDRIHLISINILDFRSVLQAISKVKPDEIYNLAGQSSVGLSFEQPVETMESNIIGVLNILEVIRFTNASIKFYNAGSSEVFGDTKGVPANETTSFYPKSPYAVAKSAAFWEVANYRESYNLFACTGILFNHESPLRPVQFVTQKIIAAVLRIVNNDEKKLELGNIDIKRDWGWAPEYVVAMWKMLNQDTPDDYVIATGETRSLKDFIDTAFSYFGLNWNDYVVVNENLFRPSDFNTGVADPSKAKRKLGWEAKLKMEEIVNEMIKAKLDKDYIF